MEAKSKPKLTYEDFVCFPDDSKRHELIDGDHYVTPSPNVNHQRCSKHIEFQLYQQIELEDLGEVFYAPLDVLLSDHDVVEPDLMVVLAANRAIIESQKLVGPPDLVVEILSKSTKQRDKSLKKRLYERSGVPEYWIVVPEDQAVEQHVLADGRYELAGSHATEIEYRGLPGVRVDLTKVW
jgi:Uma2 family endonuclease